MLLIFKPMDAILKTLKKELPRIYEKFNNINKGGCGEIAIFLYDELKECGVNSSIRVLERNHIKEPFENLKSNTNNDFTPYEFQDNVNTLTHLVVKINGYYVDCTGVYKTISKMRDYSDLCDIGEFPVSPLRKLVSEVGLWNSAFDRNQLPEIQSEIKNVFHKIKINEIS
jgi:hypothetical protein